jgi:ribosomal 50S subunit-recycling heat shock protein
MRLDDYLSTVGVIKRRTIAKEMAGNGLIEVNGHRAKPAHEIKAGDIITIKGSQPQTVKILQVPAGSVSKNDRERFARLLTQS